MGFDIKRRVQKVFSFIKDGNISHIVIKNGIQPFIDANFFYLTGAISGIFEDSYVVVSREGEVKIITGALEAETARGTGIDVIVPKSAARADFDGALKTELAGAKTVGLNYSGSSAKDYLGLKSALNGFRFTDIGLALDKARMIKDEFEIGLIKRACDISSKVFLDIKESIKDGLKENELAAVINYNMMKTGASGPSFDTICGFGKDSAEPHYSPHEVKINRGDLIVCDYGARYNRYCCDITRSFVYGEPSKKQKEMYDTVFLAQKAALGAVAAGKDGFGVYSAAEDIINKSEYRGLFTHGIGHSLGLEVHDSTMLRPFKTSKLEEGMVLTVEPGIYLPGFGGVRIEDDVLVTKNGYEVLTSAPKEFEEILI